MEEESYHRGNLKNAPGNPCIDVTKEEKTGSPVIDSSRDGHAGRRVFIKKLDLTRTDDRAGIYQ